MSKAQTPHADFSRYFAVKQRAYLINISEGRDREQYESLSGTIVSISGDAIALQIPYATEQVSPESGAPQTTYKLTSEAMGSGIQILADLVRVTANNVFHLKLRGNLEMYQRRQTLRVDTSVRLFQIRRDASLAVYRKEFRRIMDHLKTQGVPANLQLMTTAVNLSAGGLRCPIDLQESAAPLTMFFLELEADQPLVCAVAELAWNLHEAGKLLCGHRFVQIRKADQERLNRHVLSLIKAQGGTETASRTNWELLDRMTNEEPGKKA